MAIDYTSSFQPNLNSSDQLIQNINSLSPKAPTMPTAPDALAAPTLPSPTLSTNGSMYSMTPSDVSGDFGGAYNQATQGYAPFPTTDMSGMQDLKDQYANVPQAYDVSGTMGLMNQARSAALMGGQQASNTSANKYLESQTPGQYSGASASVLRAQSLMPYLQGDTQSALAQGQYADTARQQALSAASSIANNLAQLQQTYTDSLANYNAQKAQFGLGYANQQTGLQVQASQNLAQNALGWYQAQGNQALNAYTAQGQQQLGLYQAQAGVAQSQAQLAENARQANISSALGVNQQQQQAAQTATAQRLQAATAMASAKAPTGSWTVDNNGQVTSGQNDYNAYNQYVQNRSSAASTIGALAHA